MRFWTFCNLPLCYWYFSVWKKLFKIINIYMLWILKYFTTIHCHLCSIIIWDLKKNSSNITHNLKTDFFSPGIMKVFGKFPWFLELKKLYLTFQGFSKPVIHQKISHFKTMCKGIKKKLQLNFLLKIKTKFFYLVYLFFSFHCSEMRIEKELYFQLGMASFEYYSKE